MAWHVESDADRHVWRDHYREWLSQLQDAANEVRGYVGDLAAILDGMQASAAFGDAGPADKALQSDLGSSDAAAPTSRKERRA
jgi:hypothetical protein